MAIPNWASLAVPQESDRDGYTETRQDQRLKSKTDTGPGKFRRRYTLVPYPITVNFLMTSEQVDLVMNFITSDLEDGALPFYFPRQRGAAGSLLVQIAENGFPMVEPYGYKFNVRMRLMVMP